MGLGFILQSISFFALIGATFIPRFVEELGPIYGCTICVTFVSICITQHQREDIYFVRVILFLSLLLDSVFTIYWYKFMARTFDTWINVLVYSIIYIGVLGKMLSWNEVYFEKKKEE